ncbi:MAG: sulfur carrier protein ThiS [Clostridia bacterium]|nr:sulfur carrier protein ThiS [Clostridia bacterium]
MIKVNGQMKPLDNVITVERLLDIENYDSTVVVVEINEEIIKKSEYDKRKIKDGDKVEILKFVGGG